LRMHADHREEVEEAYAGGIVAVIGLKQTFTGDTIAAVSDPILLEEITFPAPVISVAIEAKTKSDQEKMSNVLHRLSEEDPTFRSVFDDETGQTRISGMGELHLEVIVDRMTREFGVGCTVGRPQVAYRETIRRPAESDTRFVRQTGGRGQFAHVKLQIEPLAAGSGFEFESKVRGGNIPAEYIPAVQKGVRQALDNGPRGGYPVVDVKAILVDGSFHPVDSSELAFATAGSMAFKEAAAKAHPVVLEPVMKIEIVTPDDFFGDILADLNARRGNVKAVEARGGTQIVRSELPLAEAFGYTTTLRSVSQGRATSSMEFAHYAEVPENVAAAAASA